MTQAYSTADEPVTAVFTWTVDPGENNVFERMMHDIHLVARTFPGHMGVTTLKSPTKKRNYQTILRFDTANHLDNWLNSPIRQKQLRPLEEIAHPEATTEKTGLETWFELPDQIVPAPKRWKMVISTAIAILPLSLLANYFLAPHETNWPLYLRALVLPLVAPIILTYLLMPFLTQHILKRWLYKSPKQRQV